MFYSGQCMYKHTHQSSNELNEDLCREAYRKHNANVLEVSFNWSSCLITFV